MSVLIIVRPKRTLALCMQSLTEYMWRALIKLQKR